MSVNVPVQSGIYGVGIGTGLVVKHRNRTFILEIRILILPCHVKKHPAAGCAEGLPPAPDIEVVMYQGEAAAGGGRVRLSQLWGKGKPVVLNFWAGFCPPCRAELPDFQRLYAKRGNGKFTLIGIDVGPFVGLGSRDDGKALLRELKITFPAGTTMVAAPVRAHGIAGMPTTVFITPNGKIFTRYTGMLTPVRWRHLSTNC